MTSTATDGEPTAPAPDGVKVSVVIPVYNPGAYLERCVSSLLGQSLPAGEFEVVFVDDGSTDESPARLDELAAAHPHLRVIHQPNSGWPGKPRNVGIDAARGRYVYFMDHDDALGSEALERLFAFAERTRSDIVIGKMAGHGRGAPHMLFQVTRESVTIHDSGIISALSPHKFYRTAFLREHGIRFPEGRRRLEDQVFVLETYFAAERISIYADYTCYVHLARDDRANAATGAYDPAGGFDPEYYYRFLREVLDVLEAHTAPGPERDRLLRRFVGREILSRFSGSRFLLTRPKRQRVLFDEVKSVVDRYIPTTVAAGLPAHVRTKLALVRAGRLDLLNELAVADRALGLALRFRRLRRVDGRLRLELQVEVTRSGRPLPIPHAGDTALLPVPPAIAAAVPEEALRLPGSGGGEVVVVVRRHRDSAEVPLTPAVTRRTQPVAGGARIRTDVEVEIEPDMGVEDGAMRRGRWDLAVRVYFAGYRHLEAEIRRRDRFGRSRAVLLRDGVPADGPARWRIRSALRARRVPQPLWRLAQARGPRRVLRRLLGRGR
jgi:glycosyltransferase involved in cell wall biosynthesis